MSGHSDSSSTPVVGHSGNMHGNLPMTDSYFDHSKYHKCKKQLKNCIKEVGMVVQKVCIQECKLG